MDAIVQADLLEELKGKLQITWTDEDNDFKKMILKSEAYLSNLTGASFDFVRELEPKEILLERCRYVYNNTADQFEVNYRHELGRLILNVALGKVGVIDGTTSGDV
ncbi:hypothetical protein [Bacillus suaedae]|uniref:Phage gp6-like head-tail connector protein n=1 Tax=Halalkalibacter suaedae TaxID=2822140 RepID=A0A941AN09_9BACI|nr:hypothetical protein [Bacillus suaedae]MBP3951130.1 hypothetical protein [Bacillus suaedae]